jgi:hypothetical protein
MIVNCHALQLRSLTFPLHFYAWLVREPEKTNLIGDPPLQNLLEIKRKLLGRYIKERSVTQAGSCAQVERHTVPGTQFSDNF